MMTEQEYEREVRELLHPTKKEERRAECGKGDPATPKHKITVTVSEEERLYDVCHG